MAIERIEGRCDDQLLLLNLQGRPQIVFADLCTRVIANALPLSSDYRLIQHTEHRLHLVADCSQQQLGQCHAQLVTAFEQQGIATDSLEWQLTVQAVMPAFDQKRRRIIRKANP
jgi:phenylacetate-coenzyme A ligase PaaK-like adenylate-forming protein